MALHKLVLDDMELTALITHLEGQSEMMVESRLNCSNPSEIPDREEVLLNLVYEKAFTIGWEADKNPCLLYTSPSPRDLWISRMPSSA